MKIAIICAMTEELDEIRRAVALQYVDKFDKAGNTYCRYTYGDHEIITVVSGIGKVNAAITTQILLNKFEVDAVLNVGVAGSLTQDLTFGDVVIATDLVEHDFDTTSFGDRLGQIARLDTFSFLADANLINLLSKNLELPENKIMLGRVVSGDQFIDNSEKAKFLHTEFNALACEMEGAAIAHTCYLNKVPFAVIRALSDMAGQNNAGARTFTELKYMAAQRAAQVTNNLIGNL